MKNLLLLSILLLLSCKREDKAETPSAESAKNPVEMGRELFEDKAKCATCHLPDQKVVGPGIVEITRIYKEQNASISEFLKGRAKPLVDPSQYDVMAANFAITKLMSEEELQAIEAYMYSVK